MNIFANVRTRHGSAIDRRRTIDEAVERTHYAFARAHPKVAQSLFDLHFLAHAGRPVVERIAEGAKPDAAELAQAWIGQWRLRAAVAERHVAQALPAMGDFVRLLELELEQAGVLASETTVAARGVADGGATGSHAPQVRPWRRFHPPLGLASGRFGRRP